MKPVDTIDILVTSTSIRCLNEVYRQEIEGPIKNLQTCWTPYKSVFEREEPHYIKRFRIHYRTTYRHQLDSIRGLQTKYFTTDSCWIRNYLIGGRMTEIVKLPTITNLIKGDLRI